MERAFYFLIGLVVVVGWIWLLLAFNRQYKKLDRLRFERTNAAGVLEFGSYEEKMKFERLEGWNKAWMGLMVIPGGPIFLVGLFVLFVSIFG